MATSEIPDNPILESRLAALERSSLTLHELVRNDPEAEARVAEEKFSLDDLGRHLREACNAAGLPGLRIERRRQLASIAARDLAGEMHLEDATRAVSDVASVSLQVALEETGGAAEVAVVAMGKLGGRELNYSSDIDLMFVAAGDTTKATKVVEGLVSSLGGFAPEGQAYRIDLNLRPEGAQGALVRTLESYGEYYARWAKTWEHQALIKARPVAGNDELGA